MTQPQILTDAEIEALAEGIAIDDFNHDFGRRIIAAVLAKLAGAEVPEHAFGDGSLSWTALKVYTLDQLLNYGAACAAKALPGKAFVPMRLTQAMRDVLGEEGWQWEDLLAAAGAVTEEQYNDAMNADAAYAEGFDAGAKAQLSKEPVAWMLEQGQMVEFNKQDYHDGSEWTALYTKEAA